MTDEEKQANKADLARRIAARHAFDRAAALDIKHTLARAAVLRRQARDTWHPCPHPDLLLLEADALEARATALVLDAEPGDVRREGVELVGEGDDVRAQLAQPIAQPKAAAPAVPAAPDTLPSSAPEGAALVDAQTFEARRLAGLQALVDAQAAMVGDGPHDEEATSDGAA